MASVKKNVRRLLFVAPSAYPLGGVATWLDYVLPGLEAHGWEPTLGLVAGRHHDPDRYLDVHPFHRVTRITNPTGSQEGRVRALCRAVQEVDPAVALSVNIPDLFLAQARLRGRGKDAARTVMTLHAIQADLLGDAHAFRGVLDAVICTNRLACELVRDVAEVEEERVYYAPYGVEVPAGQHSLLRESPQDNPVRIVWVGRLEEEQKRVSDIPRILEALDLQGRKFELQVVGSGPEEARLRTSLSRWISDGRAKMLGQLSREEVFSRVYPNADVFLLTSSWETGPIVIWEAMSAGLPVVTSEYVGAGPEASLVHGDNCLIFPVADATRAAEWIGLLEDSAIYSRLCSNGRALVADRYSIDASVKSWDAALQRVTQIEVGGQAAQKFTIAPRGRLDHLLSAQTAEKMRRLFGIRHKHLSAGGEWPHSLSTMDHFDVVEAGSLRATGSVSNKI